MCKQSDNVGQQMNIQEVSLLPHIHNISISQSSKWQNGIHCSTIDHGQSIDQAIDTHETISIKYRLLLQRFCLELQMLIARVNQQNREKVSCEYDIALQWYCIAISRNSKLRRLWKRTSVKLPLFCHLYLVFNLHHYKSILNEIINIPVCTLHHLQDKNTDAATF